jgi:hypothetical protein
MPWNISCLLCGALSAVDMLPADARRVSLRLKFGQVRCARCNGMLSIEPGFVTCGARQVGMPITADELRGPKSGAPFVEAEKVS